MNWSFLTIKSDAEELPRFDAEGQPLLPHGWPFTRDGQARAEKKYVVIRVDGESRIVVSDSNE